MFEGNPNSSYIVVRKGYSHPEIAVKMASVQFDYVQDKEPEFTEQLNKDGMLLNMHIGYDDSFIRSGAVLEKALKGEIREDEMSAGQKATLRKVTAYLQAVQEGNVPSPEDWETYKSRVEAYQLLLETPLVTISPVFVRQTDSIQKNLPELEELEQQTMLRIVTGERPLDTFDIFVEEWLSSGGEQITEEVNRYKTQNE